jgi:hypothetical protein
VSLNPHQDIDGVPPHLLDWMMLMRESMAEAKEPALNDEHDIIRRATSLIDEGQAGTTNSTNDTN